MSIETKFARAMSELDERGVLVLQDPEIDTTRITRVTRVTRVTRGWKVTTGFEDEPWGDYFMTEREQVEKTIRSWLKCQEQIDSL